MSLLDAERVSCLPFGLVKNGEILRTHLFGAAPTIEHPSFAISQSLRADLRTYETDRGTHVIEGIRIFRTGTFTDMFGREATWEDIHLDQMVAHFHLLKERDYLVDVPVRADHSFSVKDVVGYYLDIYRDKDEPEFLAADIEITEDDAWEKWDKGTWRARSLEVGEFHTNDGMTFWPVVLGLAFVDIGAVQGLHSRQQSGLLFHQVITDTEDSMTVPDITKDPEGWIKAVNYAAWVQAAQYAQACADWERAVNYAAALDREAAGNDGEGAPQGGQPAIVGNGGTTPPASHATQPPAQPMSFRVNGQQTQDFRTVQSHIDTLEQFRTETTQSNRTEFVAGLARDNKIAATQIASLTVHAQSLTDEQFSFFRATYEAAPSLTVLGNHGNDGGDPPASPEGGNAASLSEIETAKGVVQQFRLSGMDAERIKATPSYKKLVAAGVEPA